MGHQLFARLIIRDLYKSPCLCQFSPSMVPYAKTEAFACREQREAGASVTRLRSWNSEASEYHLLRGCLKTPSISRMRVGARVEMPKISTPSPNLSPSGGEEFVILRQLPTYLEFRSGRVSPPCQNPATGECRHRTLPEFRSRRKSPWALKDEQARLGRECMTGWI